MLARFCNWTGLVALVALGALGAPADAQAQAYGEAGCGLGTTWFGKEDKQVLAWSTNNVFAAQSFAISSGTSGCGEVDEGEDGAEAFIEGNRDALARDISRGNGETVASLTQLAGCANAAQVGEVLQSEFPKIYTSAEATDREISQAMLRTLRAHSELACSQIS
jgi:hypothetical protein